MKFFLSSLFTGLLVMLCWQTAKSQATPDKEDALAKKTLTKEEMQEDFRYLRKMLEGTHPGLYRYNTKQQMDHTMDSLYGQITAGMKFYDYYRLLSWLISDIRCAHTNILPSADLNGLIFRCKTFPYWVFYAEGQLYITGIGTRDTLIKPGFELVSINEVPVDSIKQMIFKHVWADGYIEISKHRMLDENFFSLFYYFFVDQPDTFTLKCRTPDGKVIEHKAAATAYPVSINNLLNNPVNKTLLEAHAKRNKLNQKKSWRVEINKEKDAAIITITGFGGGSNGDEAAEKMRHFMDAAITTIKKNKINNLIIDLRVNHGGWDNQGEELFTYLIDTPHYYYRKFHAVTINPDLLQESSISKDELKNLKNELNAEPDGTFSVKEEFNSTLLIQHPKNNRFTGKIYVMMDGASGSTTAEFIAVVHSNKVATLVGEECGGNYTGGNGGEFISLKLPNSGMQASIPLLYYDNAVEKPELPGRGTLPDYTIPYNIKDVLSGTDTQLNFVLGMLKQSRTN